MKTFILIYNKQIIGIAKAESKKMARDWCINKLGELGVDLDMEKIQTIEFSDNQILIF